MRRGAVLAAAVLAVGAAAQTPPTGAEKVALPGIENAYRLSPRLYSGGQPEGDAAFKALRALGVRTILSVDGAPTDPAAAHRHGLRYVHLPIGYDGLEPDRVAQLVKVVQTLPGPIYVHCHHGKHRGPAAAAVCAMAAEGWSKPQARAWLERAGTSPDYAGLYAAVAAYQPPGAAALAAIDPARDLPEQAEVPALVESMTDVDARWSHLQPLTLDPPAAKAPPAPLAPEALLLSESFREAARRPDALARGPAFVQSMTAAADTAAALHARLSAPGATPRDEPVRAAARLVARSCTDCHHRFRD